MHIRFEMGIFLEGVSVYFRGFVFVRAVASEIFELFVILYNIWGHIKVNYLPKFEKLFLQLRNAIA